MNETNQRYATDEEFSASTDRALTKHRKSLETLADANDSEVLLQVLGTFVHGALFGGHLLGAVFNWRRRNWFDVGAHGLAGGYDFYATLKHYRRVQELTTRLT